MMDAKAVHSVGDFLLTFILIITSTSSNGKDLEKKLDPYINKVLTCRDIVGMNLAVVQGGKTLLTQGYGVKNLNTNEPITNTSMFSVASLSKAFTTTLLAKLLSETKGKYNWDTPVRKILGKNFYFYDAYRTLSATLRDLAAHKMGILSNNDMRLQSNLDRPALARKMRFLKAYYPHRTKYVYNNLMYGLLSYISEVLHGKKSWETLMTEKIFRPLGMDDSTFTHTADLTRSDIALPYMFDNVTYRHVPLELFKHWGTLGGSGSIFTNANDMAKYLMFHLNNGRNHDDIQVVPRKALKETHTGAYNVPTNAAYESYKRPVTPVTYSQGKYALGWRTGYYRGLPIVTHTGTSWGYGALLTLVPSMQIGIYTGITGQDHDYLARRMVHLYTIDLLLGETPWLNLTTACTFPEPWSRARPKPPNINSRIPELGKPVLPLVKYTGTYGNFAYGNITVYLNHTTRSLRIKYGPMGLWDLFPMKKAHTFFGKGIDVTWAFKMEAVFKYNTGQDRVVSVKIPPFQIKQEIVFMRDLKMSDAPPPPELFDWDANLSSLRNGGDRCRQLSFIVWFIIAYLHFSQM